jgi:hypothetical protein
MQVQIDVFELKIDLPDFVFGELYTVPSVSFSSSANDDINSFCLAVNFLYKK